MSLNLSVSQTSLLVAKSLILAFVKYFKIICAVTLLETPNSAFPLSKSKPNPFPPNFCASFLPPPFFPLLS